MQSLSMVAATMRLAVIIPTYSAHLKYLNETFKSIQDQTRKADLVILAASSIQPGSDSDVELLALTNAWSSILPLQVLQTAAVQPAGKNRNDGVAAAAAAGMDLVSFIDSDDLMAPRRLEIVEQVFMKHGSDVAAVVHDYTWGASRTNIPWVEYPEFPTVLLGVEELKGEHIKCVYERRNVPIWRPTFIRDDGEEQKCHMAHLTARIECFRELKYDIRPTYYEDTRLVAELIYNRFPVACIDAILSMYYVISTEEKAEERKDL